MKRFSMVFCLLFLMVAFVQAGECTGWEKLFNGENLDGWRIVGDQQWTVEDGTIVVNGTGEEMGWLVHEKTCSDFILRLRFKWTAGNSGIQVRSFLDGDKMIGYQANLDPSRATATGSLVEENGRGLLKETTVQAKNNFKKNEWNTYEISSIGSCITIYVNGEKMLELDDPDGVDEGIIALQMGPGAKGWMAFDDIRVLEIPKQKSWEPLFDGNTFGDWITLGEAWWKIQDGAFHGQSFSDKGGYGWLHTKKEYSNFHFSTRFKVPSGNSGIQFRSWPVDKIIHGFQADLDNSSDWISGHLYDQSEKGILVKPPFDSSKIINWEGWNTYEITAIGPKVELFINGIKTIEHSDETRTKGIFGFQIHSGKLMETFWKDIRIINLD